METLLVFTNMPNAESAQALASSLIENRLASCVNILAPCRSIYRWQGRTEGAEEVPLLVKTTTDRYPALEQAIIAQHPYELPEIIAVPISRGLPAYLNWVAEETRGNPDN